MTGRSTGDLVKLGLGDSQFTLAGSLICRCHDLGLLVLCGIYDEIYYV